ncbi:uncharacterized protein UTRI_06199_B [Ustilago trichophora]|uniref:Uncharacterized protein n=1 Tax=Ustilago trichophora TaxID=86804 RepID=A0A5C3EL02_9BASI|nr:uncharacterized protein UTRI_06199_B [Ustilago trichophora]
MSKLRLVEILCIFLMMTATCTAVLRWQGELSDEAMLLNQFNERMIIPKHAVTGLENHLRIPQGQLRPIYLYDRQIEAPFLRHQASKTSRFVMYEHGGTTYFASPWMIAAPGRTERAPSALLLKQRPDRDVQPIGHVLISPESEYERLQRAAELSQRDWLRQSRHIVLPVV